MLLNVLISNGLCVSVMSCGSLEVVSRNWISLKGTQQLSRVQFSSRGMIMGLGLREASALRVLGRKLSGPREWDSGYGSGANSRSQN